MKSAAIIALIILCAACSRDQARVSLPAHIDIAKPEFATQRFLATNSADVAFDTATGSLCKTWDWRDVPVYGPANISNRTSVCSEIVHDEQRARDQKEVAMADARRAK